MMKLIAIACVVVVASAAVHNDEWCHEHHLGSGPASCVKWEGCCFSDAAANIFDGSQALGPCHSCDRHMDSWCAIYGGSTTDECLEHGGCTFDSETNECKSAKPEPISPLRTCFGHWVESEAEVAAYKACVAESSADECEELYSYSPDCLETEGGEFYKAYQTDGDSYFCVDKNGHEIPDTRKPDPLKVWHIDCEKKRGEALGYQCPNAITLTTKGGVVIVNKDNDAKDCKIHCNTDKDCQGDDWCCFNGCGYTCQLAVLPMSGCAQVPGNEMHEVTGMEGGTSHGVEISMGCKDGFDVIPVDQPQSIALTCKHGHWETLVGERDFEEQVDCQKSCPTFQIEGVSVIDGRDLRARDFVVKGEENRFSTAEVSVSCKPGYGVVAGTERAKAESMETLTCNGGYWVNEFNTPRSIECSVCYDAYEFEWRDEKGNSCDFYATRPMQCNENEGARANCRVSCRSCLQAEELFKVRNTVNNLDDIPEDKRGLWKKVMKMVPVTKQRIVQKEVTVDVTVELPMSEVCTDGKGSNIRKPETGCPPGYSSM